MGETLRCPKCGHGIDRENPVCPGCGAKLKVKTLRLPEPRVLRIPKAVADANGPHADVGGKAGLRFCTQCGRKLEAWQKFCPGCGAAAEGARTAERSRTDTSRHGCPAAGGSGIAVTPGTAVKLVALVGACVCAILWIAGCADAASSVAGGMNYLTYRMKANGMNPISRSGFEFYMETFTDVGETQKKVEESMDELRRLLGR